MKLHTTLLAASLLCSTAFAAAPASVTDSSESSFKRLSGSLNVGYETNYNGRGLVMSHSVAEGDSAGFAALKLNYDFGRPGYWSIDSALVYRDVPSGHTLYGNPNFGPTYTTTAAQYQQLLPIAMMAPNTIINAQGITAGQAVAMMEHEGMNPEMAEKIQAGKIKQANIEPEFVVMNSVKYTREKWNVALGHDFIHGGILGVMAKHYRDQGASCVNEVFVRPEWTPAKWVSVGCTTRFSFQGIVGWWFEPDVTFKAPVIGTPEDVKLAGVVQFGLTATADYFRSHYFACDNGTQGLWIKLSTPWFVTKNFIITPSVSFNWLGKGAINANKTSEFRRYSENSSNTPFRNFGVIGGCAATYTF